MFVTHKIFCMKKLLFSFFLLISAASMAQEKQSTTNALGKRYLGVQHQYRGNEWTLRDGQLIKWANPLVSTTHFVYGQRLKKQFFFETGLVYAFRSDRSNVNSFDMIGPIFRTTLSSTHAILIPIALRYRGKGEQWRFTASSTFAGLGIAVAKSNILSRRSPSEQYQSDIDYDSQFIFAAGLGLEVGCEYQLAPNWMIRADTGLEFGFNQNTFSYTPNLRIGLFKSINR